MTMHRKTTIIIQWLQGRINLPKNTDKPNDVKIGASYQKVETYYLRQYFYSMLLIISNGSKQI